MLFHEDLFLLVEDAYVGYIQGITTELLNLSLSSYFLFV